ncbi:MAG TPA: diacylglycerol kinase family protein [Thermoanaerobaculia bacterium]|nr:diacylglycerol kinase family protein [Thermoanaerobaculia bacterium]
MRFGVILNPNAGTAQRISELILRLPAGQATRLFPLGERDQVPAALADALEAGIERLVIAGGDGTVHQVVEALAPGFPPIELAILPLGTGNDLARSLGLADGLEEAIDAALGGEAVAVDAVRLTAAERQSWFVNVANGGFGGRVAGDLSGDDKRRWGPLAYWMSTIATLVHPTAYEVELTVDDERHQLAACGVAVANGRFVGGGFPVAPTARLDDGLLDVTTVDVLPAVELMAAGVDFALGRDPHADQVRTFRGKRIQVHSEPDMPFSIDGEPSWRHDATFEVVPGALRMVPGPHPPALGRWGERASGWRYEMEPPATDVGGKTPAGDADPASGDASGRRR